MDVLAPVKRFDRFQQRHRGLAIPMAVIRKFGQDGAGRQAALVAYYAFFSLFPLLLVFVTILGYVLQHNPGELTSVENSVRANFPAVGSYLKFSSLHGSLLALILGVLTSLWSGLGVTNAAQNAFDTVWAVPFKERPDFLQTRLRGLMLLVSLGLLFLVATAASGLVTGGLGGAGAKVAGIAVSLLANIVLFLAAFRLMTSRTVRTSCLWVGVLVAAVFWTILQAVGGLYVGHTLKHLPAGYTSFAFVIGLLVWLHLGAQMTLYAAEVNVVVERRLWPRSLLGPPVEPADQRALTDLAKVEERHPAEIVDVSFDEKEIAEETGDGAGRSDAGGRQPDAGNRAPDADDPARTADRPQSA
jgi:YihY family inner membrane protein